MSLNGHELYYRSEKGIRHHVLFDVKTDYTDGDERQFAYAYVFDISEVSELSGLDLDRIQVMADREAERIWADRFDG